MFYPAPRTRPPPPRSPPRRRRSPRASTSPSRASRPPSPDRSTPGRPCSGHHHRHRARRRRAAGRAGHRQHHHRRRQRLHPSRPAGPGRVPAQLRRRRIPANRHLHPGGRRCAAVAALGAAHRRARGHLRCGLGGRCAVGGITVSTTVGGTTISSGTPTTGDVGRFVLGSLPTPATYVLTIAGPGFGSTTEVIDLGPGEQRTDLAVTLASGTGQITGRLVDATGPGSAGRRSPSAGWRTRRRRTR